VQVKLLRALQEGEVRPVGQSLALHVDVRVVAATNADLAAAMAQGRFRADLYYRLAVVTLQVPPLRERIQDLPLLCAQLLPRVAARTGRPLAHVAPDALALLSAYAFPGNVRELENLLEHAALLGRGPVLTAADLPAALRARISPEPIGLDFRHARQAALLSFEQAYVGALLRRTAGNVSAAARQAGLDRANFRRLMRRLGMDRRQFS
jgi:DNA-binding NtrC family response regulator